MSTNGNIVVADHGSLIHTPAFWDPRKAYIDYVPDLEAAYREGVAYKLAHNLESAHSLIKRGVNHAIMLTDLEEGFRDNGELPVIGTDDVVLRVAVRLLNGTVTPYYTTIVYSLDGHPLQHISFDTYWRDVKGNALDISKHGKAGCLRLVDEDKAIFEAYAFDEQGNTYVIGLYRPQFDPFGAVAYWKHLQKTGQGDIWVFVTHCVIGTKGANLHPLLMEVIAFAAGARSIQPTILNKGHLHDRDWFSPLVPCLPDPSHPQGGFQKGVIDDAFKPALTVDFAGVAEDFCHYYMLLHTMEYLAGTPYLQKLRFMTDGTAPIVPNAKHVIALNARAQAEGIIFITHDSPFEV